MKLDPNKKHYTMDDVVGAYNADMMHYINDSKRVIGRSYSPEHVESYAVELHKKEYSNLLHPYVIDQYRAKYHEEEARKQQELDDYIAKLPK